jgi:hypothetical protein
VENIRIVGLCVLAAVGYGIAHDQVTARVCVEYFTIGHPLLIPSESPTALAFVWGIVATWWVGLSLGAIVAIAARCGGRPKLGASQLRRPVGRLLAFMGVCALIAGAAGYVLARLDLIWLRGFLAEAVPSERHDRFLAALWAHTASYATGVVGGLTTAAWIFRSRRAIAETRGFS